MCIDARCCCFWVRTQIEYQLVGPRQQPEAQTAFILAVCADVYYMVDFLQHPLSLSQAVRNSFTSEPRNRTISNNTFDLFVPNHYSFSPTNYCQRR